MKLVTTIRAALVALFACLALPAFAQSGTPITGAVGRMDVDAQATGNVVVYMNPAVAMCGTGNPIITYLIATDPGFKASLALLQTTKLTGGTVVIYSTYTGGVCRIGYVVVN